MSVAPVLDSRDNEALACAYQESRDPALLDALLQKNERLLHHVLKRFSCSTESYEDLFQVARVGLIKAAQRFDPDRGNTFSTYAVAIVDGEVRHHLRDSLLMRQPRWARTLYARIQSTQTDFCNRHGRSPSTTELAEAVNVQEEGVLEMIRVYGDLDLRTADGPFPEPAPCKPDPRLIRSLRQESFTLPIEDRVILTEALARLSELHRRIIYLLFFKDCTQQQVAEEMGLTQRTVSRERVKALSRLKAILGTKLF